MFVYTFGPGEKLMLIEWRWNAILYGGVAAFLPYKSFVTRLRTQGTGQNRLKSIVGQAEVPSYHHLVFFLHWE